MGWQVGCEARLDDLLELDDGRYILETTGTRPFRVLEITRWAPTKIAIVEFLRDAPVPPTEHAGLAALELAGWEALQDIAWLAAEVFDKRSWLPLLMGMDGKQHPLGKMRALAPAPAPGPTPADAPPEPAGIPAAGQAPAAGPSGEASWGEWGGRERMERFSWAMMQVLRRGIPGLWDVSRDGEPLSDQQALALLQSPSLAARLRTANEVLDGRRAILRQHQRLKDLMENRTLGDDDAQ